MRRPIKFSPALAEGICARLSRGEPLAEICRGDGMPSVGTVAEWRKAHAGFSADFARAREEGGDAIAADCLSIADDGANDTYEGREGRSVVNHDVIQRSKLRIETRLKLLAKWFPHKYGDRPEVSRGGSDPLLELLREVRNGGK